MHAPEAMPVIDTVVERRSIRSFLPAPVNPETVRAILAAASRSASGTNIQPWLVHVVTGTARQRLTAAVLAAVEAGEQSLEYEYLAAGMKEPWLSRRRQIGYALYENWGIARSDYAARKAAMLRNYEFFGAPVGMFFTMARQHALGAWLDCGMFMQNVMILARAYGLETCPQQAWCDYGAVVHRELAIPDDHILLSGMALGFSDDQASVNKLRSPREPIESFTKWHR
jgi:nitroreductase